MTALNPDPLQAAEDVPPFRRRPSDEEVAAMLRSRRPTALPPIVWSGDLDYEDQPIWREAFDRTNRDAAIYREGVEDGMAFRPGAIIWLLWAVSLLLAALAGALVRGML